MKIQWSDGWVEQFSEPEFDEVCDRQPRTGLIYKRGEPPRPAQFYLTVRGRVAELDYGGKFTAANESEDRGWDIGDLRIMFKNDARNDVARIEWKDRDDDRFYEIDNACSWKARNSERFDANALDDRKRAIGAAVLRPGQLRFRNSLRSAYGGGCCMTGFDIWEALEAAHIRPYFGPGSDHVQNGLLLRADLHRLFDKNLIGIEPRTMRISLAPEIRENPLYKDLVNREIDLPRHARERPSRQALDLRWAAFKRARH